MLVFNLFVSPKLRGNGLIIYSGFTVVIKADMEGTSTKTDSQS